MPYPRPTLPQIFARVQADVAAEMESEAVRQRRTPERAFAKAYAGAAHEVHGRLAWALKQLFPTLAEGEYLDRWLAIWLEGGRLQGSKASGQARATGTDSTVIPDLTVWERGTDGRRYIQQGAATITGGVADVTLVAEEIGTDGNADIGTTLSLASPIAGVDTDAIVLGITFTIGSSTGTDGIRGGADVETDEDALARLLRRIQLGPKYGKRGDFEAWTLDTPIATRAWELPKYGGPLTMGLFFVQDDDPISIIPSGSEIADLQAIFDAVAPFPCEVTVYQATAVPLNPQIQLSPDTPEVRAAVMAELTDLLRRKTSAKGTTIPLSNFAEAVARAPGEDSHVLISPAADLVYAVGEIGVLGTPTWI